MNDGALLAFAGQHPVVACVAMVMLAATVMSPFWFAAWLDRPR